MMWSNDGKQSFRATRGRPYGIKAADLPHYLFPIDNTLLDPLSSNMDPSIHQNPITIEKRNRNPIINMLSH